MTEPDDRTATRPAVCRSDIRPFHVSVPEDPSSPICADASRRRDGPSGRTVTDDTQGVQFATMQTLASYWATDYDWRKGEAKINALPNFITEIDGLDIHFIHVKSKEKNALPMIITHGWPGSIIEQMKVIDPLTNPTAYGGKRRGRVRCRDPVAAGLRILRQADGDRLGPARIAKRVDDADAAPRLHEVRGAGRRLGECGLGDDGAAGAAGTARHLHQHGGDGSARDRQGAGGGRARRHRPSRLTSSTRGSSSTSSTRRGWATPTRWRSARRRSTRSRIHRSAWRRGCSITTRAVTRSSRASSTDSAKASRATTSSTTSRCTG